MRKVYCLMTMMLFLPAASIADDNLTLDATIGGAVGGAIGGAIGAEVGGREGAIIGAGVGAAAGAAVNTRGYDDHHQEGRVYYYDKPHHRGTFCPPGQTKKGRC